MTGKMLAVSFFDGRGGQDGWKKEDDSARRLVSFDSHPDEVILYEAVRAEVFD